MSTWFPFYTAQIFCSFDSSCRICNVHIPACDAAPAVWLIWWRFWRTCRMRILRGGNVKGVTTLSASYSVKKRCGPEITLYHPETGITFTAARFSNRMARIFPVQFTKHGPAYAETTSLVHRKSVLFLKNDFTVFQCFSTVQKYGNAVMLSIL